MASESDFQKKLIKELKSRFPGCMVLKNDSSYIQGIPDLIVLYGATWAMLECKKSAKAKKRPNQKIYIDILNKMAFARFIYPENKEAVLNAMARSFERFSRRDALILKPEFGKELGRKNKRRAV